MVTTTAKIMSQCRHCDIHLTEFNSVSFSNSLCRCCHALYKRNRYQNLVNRQKQLARSAAYRRLKKGIIVKESCKLCSNPEVEMHHPDYSKPNDIVWLCIACHNEIHSLEKKAYASRAA